MAIIINNKSYVGNSVSISRNKVIIDGVDVTPDSKTIEITVNGNIESIDADMCDKITVNGNVTKDVKSTSGDIICKEVGGNVSTTSGDIECENVGGSVTTTSGDVKANNVSGSVKTLSGDIRHR